jgi:hypothetical protein
LPIRVEPQSLWLNVGLEALARRRNLAAYDAAYLDQGLRTRLPLATSDDLLQQAAIAEDIVLISYHFLLPVSFRSRARGDARRSAS